MGPQQLVPARMVPSITTGCLGYAKVQSRWVASSPSNRSPRLLVRALITTTETSRGAAINGPLVAIIARRAFKYRRNHERKRSGPWLQRLPPSRRVGCTHRARLSRRQARTRHEAIPPAQSQRQARRPQPISMLWSEGPVVLAAMTSHHGRANLLRRLPPALLSVARQSTRQDRRSLNTTRALVEGTTSEIACHASRHAAPAAPTLQPQIAALSQPTPRCPLPLSQLRPGWCISPSDQLIGPKSSSMPLHNQLAEIGHSRA